MLMGGMVDVKSCHIINLSYLDKTKLCQCRFILGVFYASPASERKYFATNGTILLRGVLRAGKKFQPNKIYKWRFFNIIWITTYKD